MVTAAMDRGLSGYVDVSRTPCVQALERNWLEIRSQIEDLLEREGNPLKINGDIATQEGRYGAQAGKPKYLGKNVSIGLKVVPELLDRTEDHVLNDAAEARRERRRFLNQATMACLRPVWNHVGNLHFNALYPGASITAHYGTFGAKNYVRVHLGLRCPAGAVFHIEGHPSYMWQEGKTMGFNDHGSLHWVTHTGDGPRLILCVDLHKSIIVP